MNLGIGVGIDTRHALLYTRVAFITGENVSPPARLLAEAELTRSQQFCH